MTRRCGQSENPANAADLDEQLQVYDAFRESFTVADAAATPPIQARDLDLSSFAVLRGINRSRSKPENRQEHVLYLLHRAIEFSLGIRPGHVPRRPLPLNPQIRDQTAFASQINGFGGGKQRGDCANFRKRITAAGRRLAPRKRNYPPIDVVSLEFAPPDAPKRSKNRSEIVIFREQRGSFALLFWRFRAGNYNRLNSTGGRLRSDTSLLRE